MRKSLYWWQFAGFIFTALAGTLLHFLFELTGNKMAIGLFSPVNESIWEHLKLLYFPMLLFSVIEYRIVGKKVKGFWDRKFLGTVLGVLLILTFYYTYTGIFGRSLDWLNILIFFVAAAFVYAFETWLFCHGNVLPYCNLAAPVLLVGISVIFFVFTFFPPKIPLFRDPATGLYGISPHFTP